jgi:hypothetical protein
MVPTLVDDPQYRLAGAEDMLRQFAATTDRLIDRYLQSSSELDTKAKAAFDSVAQYAHAKKGARKPTAAEFSEALRQYPRHRFQSLLHRHLASVYQSLRVVLTAQLAEVSAARQRLDSANQSDPKVDKPEPPREKRQLLPPGCVGINDAVEQFVNGLTDADLNEIDRRVQMSIEPEYGTVFQACLNSVNGSEDVIAAVHEETRLHLDSRLGEANLAAMFAERYPTPELAERALQVTFRDAVPAWVANGPWMTNEVAVLGCPSGSGGDPLRDLARRALPVKELPVANMPDNLTLYREWPTIPINALPHVGEAGAAAYRTIAETQQCSPHARIDVMSWSDVDAP